MATRSSAGGGNVSGSGNSSNGSLGGIGWTGATAEERAEYAGVAESVLGSFVDGDGRGEDVAYARRQGEALRTVYVFCVLCVLCSCGFDVTFLHYFLEPCFGLVRVLEVPCVVRCSAVAL